MPRKQTFLTAVWSEQWKASYLELSSERQAACDEAAISLIKYYLEARINSGDRIVFRTEEGTIFFIDVVKHDDIGHYGKRRKK